MLARVRTRVAVLLGCVLLGATLRVAVPLADEGFDAEDPRGVLKSDPGLLYYLTERVIGSGGSAPSDWRADPRIEHPSLVDVPATFTVGQEFLVAFVQKVVGPGVPLHVLCTWVMAVVASSAVLGVYALARELSGSESRGLLAALLWTALPSSYRTVGFVLVREDLSLALFALHLGLAARAWRVGSRASSLFAGAALAGALATWHAMGFVVLVEVAVALAWLARRGQSPFDRPGAWLGALPLAAAALFVPALSSRLALLSPALVGVAALLAASLPAAVPRVGRLAAAAATALGLGLVARARGAGGGDFDHVFAVLFAKLRHLGTLPADPAALPFDARLLWQGPFAGLSPPGFALGLGAVGLAALPALVLGVRAWRGPLAREQSGLALVAALALVSSAAALAVARLVPLAGLFFAPLAALAPRRFAVGGRWLGVGIVLGVLQVALLVRWARSDLAWYRPLLRQAEIAGMVRELPRFVPAGDAVASDFMNATAVLAHTGRPIVFQPKWESATSRARIEDFFQAFYHGTPEDLRRLLVERYDCRWLLVDRYTLWILRASRYAAGFPRDLAEPPPGTAAAALLSRDASVLGSIPGYELVWRSSPRLVQSNGAPSDFFRLFRLDP